MLQLIRHRYSGTHERNHQVDREMAVTLRQADRDILTDQPGLGSVRLERKARYGTTENRRRT